MSYPDPEIVKSDGLLRLKWEEEENVHPVQICFALVRRIWIIAARNRFLHH